MKAIVAGCTSLVIAYAWAASSVAQPLPISVQFESGFTSGAQAGMRQAAFNRAMQMWSQTLNGTIPIQVRATFTNLNNPDGIAFGDATQYIPRAGRLVSATLASQLDGVSYDVQGFHMFVNIDGTDDALFYYALDEQVPQEQVDFVGVVLHEFGHGLGFHDNTDSSSGQFNGGVPFLFTSFYVADPFGLGLFDPWVSIQASERAVLIASGDVFFNGTRTNSFATQRGGPGVDIAGFSEIQTGTVPGPYVDPPLVAGVLSHWHTKHSPDMVMEATSFRGKGYSALFATDLVVPAFADIGWSFNTVIVPIDPVFPPLVPSGGQRGGSSTAQSNFVIRNMKLSSISISSVSLSGPHASDFSIISGGSPTTVPAASTHTIRLEFAPSSVGYKTASLVVDYNDGAAQSHTAKLIGFGRETDTDGDRISDFDETRDLDPNTPGTQNPFNPNSIDSTANNFQSSGDSFIDGWNDWDGDGMNNEDEFVFGYNPIDPASFGVPSATDSDGDGISDAIEMQDLDPNTPGIQNPFDPFLGDTTGNNGQLTGDGIPDGQNDFDGDGLSNFVESVFGINPYLFDTDGDGFGDGAEAAAGTGIFDPNDTPPTDIMWVDFAYTGVEAGTQANPFNTFGEVATLLDSGGLVNIKGNTAENESSETPTIVKPMTIEASGGTIRIGVQGMAFGFEASEAASATNGEKAATYEGSIIGVRGRSSGGTLTDGSPGDVDTASSRIVWDKAIFETAIPLYTFENQSEPDGDPVQRAAEQSSTLALRLLTERSLTKGSAEVQLNTEISNEAYVRWQTGDSSQESDQWLLLDPIDGWSIGEELQISASIEDMLGEVVQTDPYSFVVVSNPLLVGIQQPVVTSNSVTTESDSSVSVVPASSPAVRLPEDTGLGDVYALYPDAVYEKPETIWLPLPSGTAPQSVRIFYFHSHGEDKGWYPAENVIGFLGSDAMLSVEEDGVRYVGFVVRHSGYIQLGGR